MASSSWHASYIDLRYTDDMKKILLILFPLLVAIFLAHYFLVGQAVYGDGIYYWSYTRSLYIDHDLKLNNEISHRYDHVHNNTSIKDVIPPETAERIAQEYHMPIGTSIGFLPFFAVADIVARVTKLFYSPILLNGYSDIYQVTVGIGNILYITFGLYFVFLLLKKFFKGKIVISTILVLFFTSNILYYGSFDVINSHPFSFFMSSIFLWFFFTKFTKRWYEWIILGGLVGLLAIVRSQDIVFSIFIFAALVKERKFLYISKNILLSILGCTIFILPQALLLYSVFHGHLPASTYAFDFLHPHILGVLINYKTGLLFTSPVVLIGLGGLILLAKRKKEIGVIGVALFVVAYYLISSWAFWDQAASYGIRMLISTYPVVAVGLGFVIERVAKKWGFKAIYILGAVFFLFNLGMIARFHLSVKTATYDLNSITRVEAQKKLNQVLHTNFNFFHR